MSQPAPHQPISDELRAKLSRCGAATISNALLKRG